MAEVIDSLMVRLGLEQDEQQFKQAESSFDSLRGKALQFGAAIGAGFSANELVFGFSEAQNELRRFAETFEGLGITPKFISDLQTAFALEGLDPSGAESTIRNIADLIEETDWGKVNESALARNLDLSGIQGAETAAEALAELNKQISGMENQERARRLAKALGFSDEEFLMLRQTNVGERMNEAGRLNPQTQQMTDAAEQFEEGVNKFQAVTQGFSNELSAQFTGEIGAGLSKLSSIMESNRAEIKRFASDAVPPLTGALAALGTLVTIQAARSGLGFFRNVPGLTLVAGATAGMIYDRVNEEGFEPGEEQRNPRQGARGDGESVDAPDMMLFDIPKFLDRQKNVDQPDEGSGFQFGPSKEEMEANPDLGSATGFGGPEVSYNFNIDARGATDPQATEQAVERAVSRGIAKAAENGVDDMRSSVS